MVVKTETEVTEAASASSAKAATSASAVKVLTEAAAGANNNDNDNNIQRRSSRCFTIPSLPRERSSTRTLKWPGRSRVQITCNTSGADRVRRVVCHVVGRDSRAIKFDTAEIVFIWQKHRISSSARNQPLEMLQNHEDWQAETPTIILDIPGIQAKDHHTDEELRSLTPEALSVAYPSITWARAYTDGSAEEAAKNGGG